MKAFYTGQVLIIVFRGYSFVQSVLKKEFSYFPLMLPNIGSCSYILHRNPVFLLSRQRDSDMEIKT